MVKRVKLQYILQNCSSIRLNSVLQSVLQKKNSITQIFHTVCSYRLHIIRDLSGNLKQMFLSVFLESLCRPAGCVLSEHHITESSYAGGSVILPCSCEDPKTKPEHFEWKRAVNETMVSDAEEINGRFQMIRDSPHNLFLQISNLTETDGGLYVCSVNGKQSRRVTLTLTGKIPQISVRSN